MNVCFYLYKRRPLPMLSVELAFGNNCPLVELRFAHSFSRKERSRNGAKHVFRLHLVTPYGEPDKIKECRTLEEAAAIISDHLDEFFYNSVGAGELLSNLQAVIRGDVLGETPKLDELLNHAIIF